MAQSKRGEHMNQMLKKASTTCAAFACAASLMFSGAAVVWADGEIDETVKNQIETYASDCLMIRSSSTWSPTMRLLQVQ